MDTHTAVITIVWTEVYLLVNCVYGCVICESVSKNNWPESQKTK